MKSASLNGRSENVVVKAIIVPELELCNVKMQVFLAHVMESTNDTALEDAPEALNRIGMHRANDVLPMRVIDSDVRECLFEIAIARPLIGAEQANLVRYRLVDEGLQGNGADILNDIRGPHGSRRRLRASSP